MTWSENCEERQMLERLCQRYGISHCARDTTVQLLLQLLEVFSTILTIHGRQLSSIHNEVNDGEELQ